MTDDVSPEWQDRIDDAQRERTVEILGETFTRVRYGRDYADMPARAYLPRCRDCAAKLGQLHVVTCCVERCPRCMGQAITCRCGDLH